MPRNSSGKTLSDLVILEVVNPFKTMKLFVALFLLAGLSTPLMAAEKKSSSKSLLLRKKRMQKKTLRLKTNPAPNPKLKPSR